MKIPGSEKLTVIERICLLSALPKEGDFLTLKLVRKLREALSFSEEEHKILQLQQTEGRLQWKAEGSNIVKEVHIGEKMYDLIVDSLKKLNDEKKLTDEYLSVYEKFVEGKKG